MTEYRMGKDIQRKNLSCACKLAMVNVFMVSSESNTLMVRNKQERRWARFKGKYLEIVVDKVPHV